MTPFSLRLPVVRKSPVRQLRPGWIVRTMFNNTICDGDVSVALVDDTGGTVVAMPDVTVNSGQTIVDSVDASGSAVSGFVAVSTSVSFGVCVPGVNDEVASDVVFRPMQLASVSLQNVSEPFSQNYNVLAGETRLTSIDTVTMSSGSIGLTVSNRLPMQMVFEIVLNGFRDQAGNTLRDSVTIPAATGDGSYTSNTASFDLTNVTLVPSLAVATASGLATATNAVVTSAVVSDAILAQGTGDIVVQSLSGNLDPLVTPELTVSIEEFEELSSDDFDFDDLEDAIESSTLNDGTISLAMSNSADVSLRVVELYAWCC